MVIKHLTSCFYGKFTRWRSQIPVEHGVMQAEPGMKFSLNLLDNEAQEFCELIVSKMISLFSISEDEAIKRVNCQWSHLDGIGGEKELIYHETEVFWAHDIYFGADSYWWLEDEIRFKRGLSKLCPKDINSA